MAWTGVLGGLGLFLLGMAFLTDGLEAALGSRIKKVLARLTRDRFMAFGTGIGVTALIQSSSATSLITLSLVSAGIVGLTEAIAVLIGANVGTTATAYLVSLVGLKFSVSTVALPIVGIGGLARVFLRAQKRIIADLLLGFGLLFVGIDLMQGAMAGVAASIDLAAIASPGFLGGLVLVGVGIALTALMQSSSAAMAVTLAALASGAIDLRMGAFLVIGQNVGTTATALLGSIGASAEAKRTAAAHVVFNLGTGVLALGGLPLMLRLSNTVAGGEATFALSVFHTAFNLLGALVFLPMVGVLAGLLKRTLRSDGDELTAALGRSELRIGAASSEAVRRTLGALILAETRLLAARTSADGPGRGHEARMRRLREALDTTEEYIAQARGPGWEGDAVGVAMKALDHLRNISVDLAERAPVHRFHADGPARVFLTEFRAVEALFPAALADPKQVGLAVDGLGALVDLRKRLRRQILDATGRVGADVQAACMDLEAIHWLDRVAWHLRRALKSWGDMEAPHEPVPADGGVA